MADLARRGTSLRRPASSSGLWISRCCRGSRRCCCMTATLWCPPSSGLARIGDGGDGTIGTVFDSGGYATDGHDPAQAIEYLGEHVIHVHLKDVLAPGAHESCRYSRGCARGCAPIDRCVRAVVDMGSQGYHCVEFGRGPGIAEPKKSLVFPPVPNNHTFRRLDTGHRAGVSSKGERMSFKILKTKVKHRETDRFQAYKGQGAAVGGQAAGGAG